MLRVLVLSSDVKKDLTYKAKAKAKDLSFKAKAKDTKIVLKNSLRTRPRPRTNITGT